MERVLKSEGTGGVTTDDNQDAQSSIKLMAEKHSVLRLHLEKAEMELAVKSKIFKSLEEERYVKEGTLCIAEQKLRSMNEKLFKIQNSWKEKEERHEQLVKELVDVQWKQKLAETQLQTAETSYVDFQVEKAIREDEVTRMEALDKDNEFIDMTSDIKLYQQYKDGLGQGDAELQRIMSGDAIIEIEKRKTAIRDAFCERDARASLIYVDIDEKNESIERLKQSLNIKEKQNQARLRKLRKQLQDMEETERHLKRTAEYLDRQIDPALNNKSN